jgi:hypothetical protein
MKRKINKKGKIDHDRLFKELLTTFFVDFIRLFLPEVYKYLETDSIEFIDKEIFTDVTSGEKREADLIVKCHFLGRETFFLIHLEHQSKRQKDFARRMFFYFARLHEKFGLPVYSIALFSYDKPRTQEKNVYVVEFPDRRTLEFSFVVIQLNRLNWRDFLKQENPVASALMAKMGFDETERVQVKKECLRMIVNLKLDPARTRLLSGFVDSYLRLREEEQKRFEEETKKLPKKEREKVMEITTSWEEKGIEIGLKQGERKGEQKMILLLLKARFSKLSKRTESRIQKLPTNKLEELGKALFSFQDKRDLENWLNKMSGNNH